MSKLIQHGRVRLYSARELYKKSKIDTEMSDDYIDMCCFDYQQAMEFFLKGIVELLGEKYVVNHDLRANINKIFGFNTDNKELSDVLDKMNSVLETLRQYASTFNEWETKSRYGDTFAAVSKDIELADKICSQLDECISDLYKTVSDQN